MHVGHAGAAPRTPLRAPLPRGEQVPTRREDERCDPMPETAHRGAAEARGYDDPDFLELCALVQDAMALRAGRWTVRRRTLRSLVHLRRLARSVDRLPAETVHLSSDPAGQHIRRFFRRRLLDSGRLVAITTLTLPDVFEEYLRGRSRQAVRTNCSKARTAGVTVQQVGDAEEVRERMTGLFAARDDPDGGAWYFERARLREGEFWFATGADGAALAVAEVIPDRTAALLRSMISAPNPGRSDARYLLMTEILASLSRRGIRQVLVGRAFTVPRGLVYFQKLLGFSPKNLTIADH